MFSVKPFSKAPFSTGADQAPPVVEQDGALLGFGAFSEDAIASGGPAQAGNVVNVSVDVAGVSATGAVSGVTVATTENVSVTLTGVESTGQVGTVDVTTTASVEAPVTGVSATGAVGTAAVSAGANAPVTGVEASGQVGDVAVDATENVDEIVTGVEATGAIGNVTVDAVQNISVPVTGVEATGAIGNVAVDATENVDVPVTGVEASGQVGSVEVSVSANALVTGVEAAGETGQVTVDAVQNVSVELVGVQALGAVGTADVSGDSLTSVTGVEASGQVGQVVAEPSVEALVTGVSSAASVSPVRVETPDQIVYIGSYLNVFDNPTSDPITVNIPWNSLSNGTGSNPVAGDLLFVVYGVASGSTALSLTAPTGYTLVRSQQALDLYSSNLRVYRKFLEYPLDTTITFPSGTTNAGFSGGYGFFVYRNANRSSPTTAIGRSTSNTAVPSFNTVSEALGRKYFYAAISAHLAGAWYTGTTQDGFLNPLSVFGDDTATDASLTTTRRETYTGNPSSGWYFDGPDSTNWSNATATIGVNQAVGNATCFLVGVSGSGQVGSADVALGNVVVDAVGVSASGQVGAVAVTAIENVSVDLTGVSSSGEVGSVTVETAVNVDVNVTGVEASGQVGQLNATGDANVYSTGVSATAAVGQADVSSDISVAVSGVSATAPASRSGIIVPYSQAQLSTAYAKFGPSSLRTDGGLDRIEPAENVTWGASDFTVEFWSYRTANPASNQVLFDNRTTLSNGLLLFVDSSGRIGFAVNGGTGGSLTSSATSAGQWNSIAIVRSGTNLSLYVNGTSVGTLTNSSDYSDRKYSVGAVGAVNPGTLAFNGYTDEFRISTVARTISVQTAPFNSDQYTDTLLHFDGANGSTVIENSSLVDYRTVVRAGATTATTGVEGSGQVGEVIAGSATVVTLTGVQATGAVGDAVVSADANTPVTGVGAVGQVGDATVAFVENISVNVVGVGATASVSAVQTTSDVTALVTGVQGNAQISGVAFSASIQVNVAGTEATGQVGSVTAGEIVLVPVTGVQATGSVGAVTVQTESVTRVLVDGVGAIGYVGQVSTWTTIGPGGDPNWTPIPGTQGSSWTPIL